MASRGYALTATLSWRSVNRSLAVIFIIETMLNEINQGTELISGPWPIWLKLVLTYFVLFAVASNGGYALRSREYD